MLLISWRVKIVFYWRFLQLEQRIPAIAHVLHRSKRWSVLYCSDWHTSVIQCGVEMLSSAHDCAFSLSSNVAWRIISDLCRRLHSAKCNLIGLDNVYSFNIAFWSLLALRHAGVRRITHRLFNESSSNYRFLKFACPPTLMRRLTFENLLQYIFCLIFIYKNGNIVIFWNKWCN